ncbi:MAG TPA: hypothetical protein EYP14_17695, partial [Planctomycetaceae bacterium]|nr:hypothetical protein [Planctomycetaceae bacterium]
MLAFWWLANSRAPLSIFDFVPARTYLLYFGSPEEWEKIRQAAPLSLPALPSSLRKVPAAGVAVWEKEGKEQVIFFRESSGRTVGRGHNGGGVRRDKWIFWGGAEALAQLKRGVRKSLRRALGAGSEEMVLWQDTPFIFLRLSAFRQSLPPSLRQAFSFGPGLWVWVHWRGGGRDWQVTARWGEAGKDNEKQRASSSLPVLRIARPALLVQEQSGETFPARESAGFGLLERMLPSLADFPALQPRWIAFVLRRDGAGVWLSLTTEQGERLKSWLEDAAREAGGREEDIQTRWGSFRHLAPTEQSLLQKIDKAGRTFWLARGVVADGSDVVMGEEGGVVVLASNLELAEEMLAALQKAEEKEWEG